MHQDYIEVTQIIRGLGHACRRGRGRKSARDRNQEERMLTSIIIKNTKKTLTLKICNGGHIKKSWFPRW